MARSNFWTILVVLLLLYAFIPSIQNFINGFIGIEKPASSPPDKSNTQVSSASDGDTSEGAFLVIFLLGITGIILSFYAGYQWHKRKVLKNGRFKKSNTADKKSKRRGKVSSLKDKIISNTLGKIAQRNK